MKFRPPANASEALSDGGFHSLDERALDYLMRRHTELADHSNLREWRRRWAFSAADLRQTQEGERQRSIRPPWRSAR